MTPEFTYIDNDLWRWNDWFIAHAWGGFWLLTPDAQEFGPFEGFYDVYCQTKSLVSTIPS